MRTALLQPLTPLGYCASIHVPHSTFGRRFWKGGFPSHFRKSKSRSGPPQKPEVGHCKPNFHPKALPWPPGRGGVHTGPGARPSPAPWWPQRAQMPLGLKPEVGSQKIRKCIKSSADQGPGCPKASKTPLKPYNRPKQGPTLQRLPQQGVTAKITVGSYGV